MPSVRSWTRRIGLRLVTRRLRSHWSRFTRRLVVPGPCANRSGGALTPRARAGVGHFRKRITQDLQGRAWQREKLGRRRRKPVEKLLSHLRAGGGEEHEFDAA